MLALLGATALLGAWSASTTGTCKSLENTDVDEKYYKTANTASAGACCTLCSSDPKCNYAAFVTVGARARTCYLKDAKTMTPQNLTGVALAIGGKVIFMPRSLFCVFLYGESQMKYTGRMKMTLPPPARCDAACRARGAAQPPSSQTTRWRVVAAAATTAAA
jgi:hypothetical protein